MISQQPLKVVLDQGHHDRCHDRDASESHQHRIHGRGHHEQVAVAGAGYIAVELAGMLRALGAQVSLVIRYDSVLRGRSGLALSTLKSLRVSLIQRFLTEQLAYITVAKEVVRITDFADLLDRIGPALDRLPEQHRVVLWLRDGEDLSYQQISSVLDIPIGTVRSRLARARARLREMVD